MKCTFCFRYVLGWMMVFASVAHSRADSKEGEDLIGQLALDWSVSDWFNSQPLTLESLRGKVVLVRWWTGPGCPFCSASAPILNEVYGRYHERGLEVIGFYHHKSAAPLQADKVKSLVDGFDFKFPVAIDEDWKTLGRWWFKGQDRAWTSVSFLIDKKGIIRYIHPGGEYSRRDESRIRTKIEGLLSE